MWLLPLRAVRPSVRDWFGLLNQSRRMDGPEGPNDDDRPAGNTPGHFTTLGGASAAGPASLLPRPQTTPSVTQLVSTTESALADGRATISYVPYDPSPTRSVTETAEAAAAALTPLPSDARPDGRRLLGGLLESDQGGDEEEVPALEEDPDLLVRGNAIRPEAIETANANAKIIRSLLPLRSPAMTLEHDLFFVQKMAATGLPAQSILCIMCGFNSEQSQETFRPRLPSVCHALAFLPFVSSEIVDAAEAQYVLLGVAGLLAGHSGISAATRNSIAIAAPLEFLQRRYPQNFDLFAIGADPSSFMTARPFRDGSTFHSILSVLGHPRVTMTVGEPEPKSEKTPLFFPASHVPRN